MPSTVTGVIIAIALLLPGFVIAELSLVGRARAQMSDLELVLRALFYALILHLLASPWTRHLVDEVGPVSSWSHHLSPLVAYTAVVLVIAPIALGTSLGLPPSCRAEREPAGPSLLGLWAPAMPATDGTTSSSACPLADHGWWSS